MNTGKGKGVFCRRCTQMHADERRQGKNKKIIFYHPFATLSRGTEDTEENREENLKLYGLGFKP